MKAIKLVSLLLAMLMLISSFASCNMPGDEKDVIINVEYYIDGKLVKTETLNTKQITETERYTPEEKEGYRFIGWFIDPACEIPYSTADLTDSDNNKVKLYGKYLSIGGGVPNCDHFWVMGYCRLCEAVCAHEWKNAICTVCDTPCDHKGAEIGETCKTCGKVLEPKKITITIGESDEQGESKYFTEEFDTAMYLDEILAYFCTFWDYKFRNDIYDIRVDGELVTDGSTLITKDCTILVTIKKDVIRVNTTMIDKQGDKDNQVLYLPKGGVTLDRLGYIIFPQTGGFDKLLEKVVIKIDAMEITEGSYLISKDCDIVFAERGSSDAKGEFTVKLIISNTGESYEGKFTVYEVKELSIAQAITRIAGIDLYDDLLANGTVKVNGEYIYKDGVIYDEYTEIVYTELAEGEIHINFSASGDMGSGHGETKGEIVVPKGSTFEEIVYRMLGYSWDEYEERFFSTNFFNGIEQTAVYRDTVFNESTAIGARRYKEHEVKEKVYLAIEFNFDGYTPKTFEIDYGTTLSEALRLYDKDIDLETLRKSGVRLSFNVAPIFGDMEIKYDSHLLGWKECENHEWNERVCTKCGTTCTYEYYEGNCPICRSYHPTEDQNEIVTVHFYAFSSDGEMIKNLPNSEIIKGMSLNEAIKYLDLGNLDDHLANGRLIVNSVEVKPGDEVFLYGGEKIEFFEDADCNHQWNEDGICELCRTECTHSWYDGVCDTCHIECPHFWENNRCIRCGMDDPNPAPTTLTYSYHENNCGKTSSKEGMTVPYGSTVSYVLSLLGLEDELVDRNEIYVNGSLVTSSDMTLTSDFKLEFIRTQKECRHEYNQGVCTYCHYACPHRDDGSESNICIICKMTIGSNTPACTHKEWSNSKCTKCGAWCNGSLNEGTLNHTFQGGVCTNCGCTYGTDEHYILVVWSNVDPYYVPYSMTFAEYCDMANIQADYGKYYYYQSILPYDENPDTERRELSAGTVLGEFGNSTHVVSKLISTDSGHMHEWYNSACVLCNQRCSHSFNESGKCTVCKCTHGGDDHYITVTIDYRSNGDAGGFVGEWFVPYSTTLYSLLESTWESGYSHATKYYLFYIGDENISSSTVLGTYGNNVQISTLAIAQN